MCVFLSEIAWPFLSTMVSILASGLAYVARNAFPITTASWWWSYIWHGLWGSRLCPSPCWNSWMGSLPEFQALLWSTWLWTRCSICSSLHFMKGSMTATHTLWAMTLESWAGFACLYLCPHMLQTLFLGSCVSSSYNNHCQWQQMHAQSPAAQCPTCMLAAL